MEQVVLFATKAEKMAGRGAGEIESSEYRLREKLNPKLTDEGDGATKESPEARVIGKPNRWGGLCLYRSDS
jgi:hypothetical protein